MKTDETLFQEWLIKNIGIQDADIFSKGSLVREVAIKYAKHCISQFKSPLPEISDKEIEKAFTNESYHYEKGRYYKIKKDRIFGAKWYRSELRKRNDHVTMRDCLNDDTAREERKMHDCFCGICHGQFKSNDPEMNICPSCYV